ncbi:MAG TPA: PPC domain-containing DNA-binding protein [Patescibacteria group bacterium]
MKTYTFRLRSGQDLRQEIQKTLIKHDVRAGVVLSGVGGLSKARLRLAGARQHFDVQDEFEIVSITGTASKNGSHIHLAISFPSGKTFGGHLTEGCIVRNTAEIVIGVVEGTYRRTPDPSTGYDELIVED